MKRLSVVMLAIAVNFSSHAMMDDMAQACVDLKKKLLTYKLEFQIFVEYMGSMHDWDTIEDQTAVKLRAVDKSLHAVIVAHRNKKIRGYEAWTQKHCKPFDVTRSIPTLKIDQQGTWYIDTQCKFTNFFTKTKVNVTPHDCVQRIYTWRLEPHSLVIGPSGNTLQGEAYVDSHPNRFSRHHIAAIQFSLCVDGAISIPDMRPIQRLNKKNSGIYDKEFCSLYKHDANYTRFCSVEYVWNQCDRGKKHIIVGGLEKYYVYRDGFQGAGTYGIEFNDDIISVFVHDGGICRFKEEHPYHKVLIESRFTKGGKRCDHYKHMIENLPKPKYKPLSLATIEFLSDLQGYLKACPTTTTKTTRPTILFEYPVYVVTHHYKPTDTWPLELFERVMKMMKRLIAPDNDELYDVLSERWPRYEVSDFVQVALLSGGYERYHCNTLGTYCHMQRCKGATLFCDYLGSLYYKKSYASAPVRLLKAVESIVTPYVELFPVLHDWVTCITQLPVAPENSLQYLKDHKKDALTLKPSEFITLFEERAKQYAQKTWDNREIGAFWKFDADGMRINLYALQRENNHLIGTYLVQGRTGGSVTHVECVPDAQPIIYIDGQQVDV